MANKLYNLARMTTATAGTGTITLGSAVSGYLTFALAGIADGDVVSYAIKDGSNSEIGTGTYTAAGTTLTRTVTKSTNANAAITLSGTAEVFITMRAEDVLAGTSTNDNAAAGYIGEITESTVLVGSAVAMTTAVTSNITSISLTAGDWDVWANIFTTLGGGTTVTSIESAISTTSATVPTRPNAGAAMVLNQSAFNGNQGQITGQRRLSLASTTTVYLVANIGFAVNTCSVYGYLGARRVR